MSDLVMGFFLCSKTDNKLGKEAIALKLKEMKSRLPVPGIGMQKHTFCRNFSSSFKKLLCPKCNSCCGLIHFIFLIALLRQDVLASFCLDGVLGYHMA